MSVDAMADRPDAAPLVASASRSVASCAETGTGDLPCSIELRLDPEACADRGCDKLAIFFAGGGQTCNEGILSSYVDAGYVASCVLLFGDSEAAGDYPYNDEAGRVDLSIRAVTGDPLVQAAWNGKRLLITGASHGATAPVIAMARTEFDADSSWQGSELTAACFMDGIYDLAALDELLGNGDGGDPCGAPPASVLSHSRAIGRYYDTAPIAHSCLNNKCMCDADHAPEMDEDTIVAVSPTEFSIEHWKLIECGSALDACTADVVPGEPIEALCNSLDAAANRDCTFVSLPNVSHLQCAPASHCIEWFDSL